MDVNLEVKTIQLKLFAVQDHNFIMEMVIILILN